jgi:hypothetical protein
MITWFSRVNSFFISDLNSSAIVSAANIEVCKDDLELIGHVIALSLSKKLVLPCDVMCSYSSAEVHKHAN